MAGILAFISGPWGALLSKVMLIVAILGVAYVGFNEYNHSVTQAQMLRDQNAQLVQLQKDNQDLQTKMNTLNKANADILLKLDNQNQKVVATHDRVATYIQSPEAQKSNRTSSDVIRNTIGMLQDEE